MKKLNRLLFLKSMALGYLCYLMEKQRLNSNQTEVPFIEEEIRKTEIVIRLIAIKINQLKK